MVAYIGVVELKSRPICVITDSTHEQALEIEILPPESIAQDAWGEPIWIVHYGEKHYEATETKSPLSIKEEH